MSEEILLDARWLEPPEPMEMVMQALAALQPNQHIRMLLHREPFPLYAVLENNGYRWAAHAQPDGTYEIIIRDAKSAPNSSSFSAA